VNPVTRTPRPKPTPRLGWLEATILMQTLLMALLFVPGITPARTLIRAFGTLWPMLPWAAVAASGRRPPQGLRMAAMPLLMVSAGWLLLSMAHPTTNALASGAAEVLLNISIFSPAFWVPALMTDTRQVRRLLLVIFGCNVIGVLMGIGQVYRPGTFNPPHMPMMEMLRKMGATSDANVKTDDGHEFIRPPGLTDGPGGAAMSGLPVALVGLALALSPVAWWKRAAASGLALSGVAIIFFSQVRVALIVLIVGILVLAGLLALGREVRKLALLAILGSALAAGAVGWVFQTGGTSVMKRFISLTEDQSSSVYYQNRGKFVAVGLTVFLPEYPLGAGLGRYGMMNAYFGDPFAPPARAAMWAETQIEGWIINGGIVLLVAGAGAVLAALATTARVALMSPDRELRYWAMVVAAMGTSIALMALGSHPFVGPVGLQFWMLTSAVAGADAIARRDRATRRTGAGP
jgi:hypothetical protein